MTVTCLKGELMINTIVDTKVLGQLPSTFFVANNLSLG